MLFNEIAKYEQQETDYKILKMPNQPRLLADSINWTGHRLTSFLITIPTYLLAQLRTHRLLKGADDTDLSVNANSDRAIPIDVKIRNVEKFPFIPIPTLTKSGMSGIEDMTLEQADHIQFFYEQLALKACLNAESLKSLGASKQTVNRILFPYSWSDVVVTGDEIAWNSFFGLRTPIDVEPNFRFIARLMSDIYYYTQPKYLEPGEWHISFSEESENETSILNKLYISGSCCARLSFAIDRSESIEKHTERFYKCVDSNHISIAEHQARVPEKSINLDHRFNSNVRGWMLLRKIIEDYNGIFTNLK